MLRLILVALVLTLLSSTTAYGRYELEYCQYGEPSLPHHELLVEENNPFLYMTFRATKLSPDHPGLSGRDLNPLEFQPAAIPHVVLE